MAVYLSTCLSLNLFICLYLFAQVLKVAVAVVMLAGLAAGDTKVVTPYSFPGVVVVGQAPTRAVSYVHHTAAAVPAFRASTLHYTVPQAVQYSVPQAVQYSVPQAVQYSVPQAVQYAAPAVRYPMVYSATYHQPAAAVVKTVSYDFDDDDDDDVRPLTYAAASSWDTSLEVDDDVVASPYARFDDDHFDVDDHDFHDDDRK